MTGLVGGADMLPERIRRLQEIAQSEAIDDEVGLAVGGVEHGVFVDGQRLAVAQQRCLPSTITVWTSLPLAK